MNTGIGRISIVTVSLQAGLALADPCPPIWSSGLQPNSFDGPVFALISVDEHGLGEQQVVYAGGSFAAVPGTTANNVAKWDGVRWAPLGEGTDDSVAALAIFDDYGSGLKPPSLYAAGLFRTAGGVSASHIARWDGSRWTAVAGGLTEEHNLAVATSMVTFDDDGPGPNPPALYVVGWFDHAGDVPARGAARWDGNTWSSVADGLVNGVAICAADLDGSGIGKLFVAGYFELGEVSGFRVAQWETEYGAWTLLPGEFDGVVSALTSVDLDGDGPELPTLFAGGSFTNVGGTAVSRIARWDGASWSAVDGGVVEVGFLFPTVDALGSFDPDDEGPKAPVLVVGGEFLRAGAADSMNIALWNGLSWSSPGGGVGRDDLAYSPVVYALATLGSDANSPGSSRLLVAGSFDVAGDVPVDPIAAWDGASWERLPARRGNGLNAPVAALTVHDADGSGPTSPSLYASGYFSKAGETAASSIARWDGRTWERLGNGLTFPSCDCTGPSARGLVSFDEDGTGPNPPVLIAVGSFVMAGPTQVNSIARWDGVEWSSLVGGLTSDVSNYVSASALVVFDDDADSDTPHKLYVGGAFTHAGHVPVNSIARWNGTTWSALGSGFSNDAFPGLPAEVRAFSVFDDDGPGPHVPALYAAGSFTRSGSTPVSRIAKWNGARWEPLGTGLGSSVTALAVFDADGVGPEPPALYAAGYFTTAGGISANHIAKWDGGTWSPLGTGLNDAALTLAVFDADGPGPLLPQLFVGGSFTEAGGARAGGLAAWDGAVWTPITTSLQGSYFGVPKVNALAAFQDVAGSEAPSLFVGGDFLTINALPSAHIARWSVTAPAGDFDCNRCLTKDEYVPWIGCLAGPGSIGPSPLCDRADSDFDGDVDLEDVGRFLNAIDGTCWNTNQVCKQKASCAP